MIRVLLADDQALVRHGFAMILRPESDIDVVGEAGDGIAAVALAERLAPDVVLMDVRMPELDGIEATQRIVRDLASTRVLVLTTFDNDDIVVGALRAGASGFLLKDAPGEQLVSAIRVIAGGSSMFAPHVTRRLIEEFVGRVDRPVPSGAERLSAREHEVWRLVSRGHSNADIASELFLSEHTVKTHVANLLAKLELRDRTQAVVLAYEAGVVRPGDT